MSTEHGERVGGEAAHCADPAAERPRDLVVGEVGVVPQHQDGTLPGGQGREHAPGSVLFGQVLGVDAASGSVSMIVSELAIRRIRLAWPLAITRRA